MTFVFDMGGVLSDIDVPGFMERFRQLMPEKEQCSLDPEVLLAGGGDSFLHDYELGLITTGEALNHFHALCRSDITYEQIRQVWLSELAPVQEGKKALLRRPDLPSRRHYGHRGGPGGADDHPLGQHRHQPADRPPGDGEHQPRHGGSRPLGEDKMPPEAL